MKKDAYYFPHFCNARHDRKVKRIHKDLGVEGYGIYFMILEVLREQTDFKYPYRDIDLLADEFGVSLAKVEAIVNSYDLFEIDSNSDFFSPKLICYLQPYLEKSERARMAINKRWEKYNEQKQLEENNDTNEIQMYNKCNTSKVKKSKVKESKVNKVNNNNKTIYDDFAQIVENFSENEKLKDSIQDFIEHRKSLKKPIKTIRTLELILEELKKYSSDEEKIKVINQSIVNGWQGLFELKQSSPTGYQKMSEGKRRELEMETW